MTPLTPSHPPLNRRSFLHIGAAAAIWASHPGPLNRPSLFGQPFGAPQTAEAEHLDIAAARALLAQILQVPDWLDRHLDLQSYRSASLEAIRYLAQVSLPMWTVNFEIFEVELLKAVLAADTANLRFGPRSNLEEWGALDSDALSSTMAFAFEFDMPQIISADVAERISHCNCEALRFGAFDAINPVSIKEFARFEGSLIFSVPKADSALVASALTAHEGEGLYIYSDARPGSEVIRTFRETRRKSLCIDKRENGDGWFLAWEPTRTFVQRQHGKFVST